MTLAEKVLHDFEELSEESQVEVADFVEFIKLKTKKNRESLMDQIIIENLDALKELAKWWMELVMIDLQTSQT